MPKIQPRAVRPPQVENTSDVNTVRSTAVNVERTLHSDFRTGAAVLPGEQPRPAATKESYFPTSDPATGAAAQKVFDKLEKMFGASLPAPAVAPKRLGPSDQELLARFGRALEQFTQMPEGNRKSAIQATLRNDWLANGLSLGQTVTRLELAVATGYALVDSGPVLANPHDDKGWSDGDLKRIGALLLDLPESFRNLPGLHYLTRDARSQGEDEILEKLKSDAASAKPKDLPHKLLNSVLGSLLNGIDKLNVGAAFGEAWYAGQEVRLFGELFAGSKVPGLEKMLAYTFIHELGHHQLHNQPDLNARWTQFYAETGRAEAPNGYARGSLDEGYGVAIGMYAVAPDLLKKKAPKTYEFFQNEFGDSLKEFRGRGLEGAAIELVYGLQDAAVALAGKGKQDG